MTEQTCLNFCQTLPKFCQDLVLESLYEICFQGKLISKKSILLCKGVALQKSSYDLHSFSFKVCLNLKECVKFALSSTKKNYDCKFAQLKFKNFTF